MAHNPTKKGEADNSPEGVGMKGLVPGLPSGGRPMKSGDEGSPERKNGGKPKLSGGGSSKAPRD